MLELENGEFGTAFSVFSTMGHCVPVMAVLEGNSPGRVFVNNAPGPTAALIWTKWGYYYLAGDASDDAFVKSLGKLLIEELISASLKLGEKGFVLYPSSTDWEGCLNVLLGDRRPIRLYRRIYELDPSSFARHRVCCDKIPAGFSLRRVDETLMNDALVATEANVGWNSPDDFLAKGIGFCLLRDDSRGREGVSVCCSVMGTKNDVEIGVRTVEAYRRQGFATLTAAALIEHCLANGLRPNWECFWDNEPSNALAQKLGFEAVGDHPVYYWEEE